MPSALSRPTPAVRAGWLLVALLSVSAAVAARAESPAPTPAPAKPADTKPTDARKIVAVAMLDADGVGGNGPKMLEETLAPEAGFRVTRITAEDIRAGKLAGYRVLIVPGGSSRTEATALGEDGRQAVRAFVSEGGTYVGICAGCYLASKHYKWSLGILPVTVVDSANWARGRATLKMELTAEGREWLPRKEAEGKVIYHNGPVLKPAPDAEGKLITLATYREEITRKGAKEGLMVNTPAIAAARFGRGWAVGVSPHPEQTEGLRDLVPSAVRRALSLSAAETGKEPAGKEVREPAGDKDKGTEEKKEKERK
jgi:glutamine amidotransferase-like uncharacterized protein